MSNKFDWIFKSIVRAKETLLAIGLISSLIFGMINVAWGFVGPSVMHTIADSIGVKEITHSLDSVASRQQQILQSISYLNKQVKSLKPDRIVKYDTIRSEVTHKECAQGTWCHYYYRFKRTDYGQSCSKPEAEANVINHDGIIHPTQLKTTLIRAGTQWTVSSGSFFVPVNTRPGIAQFFLQLEYNNCDFSPDKNVIENSDALTFMILPPPGK